MFRRIQAARRGARALAVLACALLLGAGGEGVPPRAPAAIRAADLDAALAAARPGTRIPVVVVLAEQASRDTIREVRRRAPSGNGGRAVAARLRALAAGSQAGVLSLLQDARASGSATDIRSLWLANVVAVRAAPGLIERLRRHPDVARVIHDPAQDVLVAGDVADVECGVERVRAPEAWADGFTGAGVTVAVLDTGTCWTHTDIANRLWVNPGEDLDADGVVMDADDVNGVDDDGNGYIDDFIGWDMTADDREPEDTDGHGSHVAGTVAGDGAGGFRAGTAPGATIMTLRVLGDVGASQSHVWEGMQYAVDNGADVISMSLGWRHSMNPDRALWRQQVDNALDAGVVVVVAAGNEGGAGDPPPFNVRTPGDVPRAITVGATSCYDFPAGFSSLGPVTWGDVDPYFDHVHPPGLVKPDVAAPGVNTKSHGTCGGYGFNSGTSMATPHVAGAIAIALEADPSLTPADVKAALEATAVDLGDAGKDNQSGSGRVDVVRVLNDVLGRPDTDGDSIPDAADLCPGASDVCQSDTDGDGLGDACDPDETWLVTVDVPAALGGADYEPETVVRADGTAYSVAHAFPDDVRPGAIHRRRDGAWLFAPADPVELGGAMREPRDLVLFDGATYTTWLSGAAAGIPAEARIDAMYLDGNGDPVVSFDIPVGVAPDVFVPGDLVLLVGGTMTRVWHSAARGVPPEANVVGAFVDNADGRMLSFDVPVVLGGATYLPGHLVREQPSGFSPGFSDGSWPPYAVLRDATVLPSACRDADCDGSGSPGDPSCRRGADPDCDDSDPEAFPLATESCDGKDNDCDGLQDEGYVIGEPCTVGVGACARDGVTACHYTGLFALCDAVAGSPSGETCGDGIDNDCDGAVDEPDAIDATTWYADSDGDGRGDPAVSTVACVAPPGHVAGPDDCDDGDPDVWATPGEAAGLVFEDKATLSWAPPADPGGTAAGTVYDTLRSETASDFSVATCVETDDGADRSATDVDAPLAGAAAFYLVRAGNACGDGSWGDDSGGLARAGRTCP